MTIKFLNPEKFDEMLAEQAEAQGLDSKDVTANQALRTQLLTEYASDGLSGKQVYAICNILANDDVLDVIDTDAALIDYVQRRVDARHADGLGPDIRIQNVNRAGNQLITMVSQERKARQEEIRSEQEHKPLSERQEVRVMQLINWLRNITTDDDFVEASRKKTLTAISEQMLVPTPSMAATSDCIRMAGRFAAIAGVELPTSANVPSAEPEAISTVGAPTPEVEDDAFSRPSK